MRSGFAVLLLAACSYPSPRGEGELGSHCYPNGTCNVGLSCSAGTCVPADAAVPDAPVDAPSIDAAVDAGFPCNNDSQYEPNNDYTTAYLTSVDMTKTLTLADLALCPATDTDTFAVAMSTPNQNLEMLVDYGATSNPPQAAILNAGGIAIANATMVQSLRIRAYTPNLPPGTFYVWIDATNTPPGEARNNYTLTINVTGP
jgi:hypothetical protein